jgi:hypothetical protein
MSAGEIARWPTRWALAWDRTYGDTRVVIYRRSKMGEGSREPGGSSTRHLTPDT